MREILFRGKRVTDGEWLEGSLWMDNGAPKIITPGNCVGYDVDPATVGQYTGLRDKNGQRIFEGDIVVFDNSPYNAYCEPITGQIDWRNGSLCFKYQPWKSVFYRSLCSDDFFAAKCDVIGNVHDNPELVEGRHEE